MDKMIITVTVNGVTNYISLDGEGQLVSVDKNPMKLPGLMTKEQAFKVVTALRQANKDEDVKYRVKAASQALRDYVTDLILNKLPEMPMVDEAVSDKAIERWKPAVKQQKAEEQPAEVTAKAEKVEEANPEAEPAAENPEDSEAFVSKADCCEEPAEVETKKSKKGKK